MNAGVLSVSAIATSMYLSTIMSLAHGAVGPHMAQHYLRHGQEDAIINSRKRYLADNDDDYTESYVDDDDPYVDDGNSYYKNDSGTTLSTIVNEAETEIYLIYENPPSEWSLTEWKIFSAIVALSLTILICCAAMCIRCCCGSETSEKYEEEEPYKSFEDYSTCSSDDSSVGYSNRNQSRRQIRTSRNKSRPEKVLSFDNDDKSPGYDKIMRLRSG